jgi:prepilin-type N-terminal cleavage/methylation domain-containing protein/prepilin-type processing-associated H-X9-DG protein
MKRGFTLTEMLTVIAIMAILMALLFPVFSTSREKARQNACLTNLKQIGTALTAYAQDYDDVNVLSHDCLLSAVLSAQVGSPVLVLYAHLLLPYTRSSIVYACGSHPQVPAIPPTPFNDPTLGLNVPSLQVSYAINANNDAVIRLDCSVIDCTRQNPPNPPPPECLRRVGFAGISRVRIPQPENRLALIEAPTENNPTLTPPNGWRLYDPTRDPTTMGCWLQALPVDNPIDCWTNQPVLYPAGRRHTGGANYLFADGSAKWMSLLQVLQVQQVEQNWVAQ